MINFYFGRTIESYHQSLMTLYRRHPMIILFSQVKFKLAVSLFKLPSLIIGIERIGLKSLSRISSGRK